jgi:putative oxidoreductase
VKPTFLISLYRSYERALTPAQDVLLLVIRLVWGLLFVQTGWGKWHDIPKVVGFFTSIGIPLPELNAYVVATTELVGGLFLAIGLLSRLTPLPLIVSMIVAYVTTEQEALHALTQGDPDPFLSAAPFLFLLASLIVLVFGPGKISADHLLAKKFFPRPE